MPSVPGKGGGRRNEVAARNGKRVGRPPKSIRLPVRPDAVWIALAAESAALAQRLLLHFPACADVAQLYALAVQRLAETTDD